VPLRSLRDCHLRRLLLLAGGLCALRLASSLTAQERIAPATPPAPTSPTAGAEGARSSVGSAPAPDWGEDYQARVKGGDPVTRMRFQVFTDDFREDFRSLLFRVRVDKIEIDEIRVEVPTDREVWVIPIEVSLWGDVRDVYNGLAVRNLVEIGPDQRFLIKLEVKLHDRFEESEYRLELLRALLIEQILAPYAGDPSSFRLAEVRPPEWLVYGFDQLIRHRRGGSPSAYYRGFLASGQILKPTELFAVTGAESLDPVRHAIFRASSSAMVEALLDQPSGDVGLRGLLGELGQPGALPVEAILRQQFPAFREMDQGLEKWWALELATLGQQQSFEYLDREETERLLTEALTVRFDEVPVARPVTEEGQVPKRRVLDLFKANATKVEGAETPPSFVGPIDQFDQFLENPAAKKQLGAAYDRLQVLKRIGFPLYRPVFVAYERAIEKLVSGNTKDLGAEFASIAELRKKIHETLLRTEDYLNHFEATRAPRRSGVFDDYMKIRRDLDERPSPRRNDPISRHLDALEWEFR
jgi:hypothetical protein